MNEEIREHIVDNFKKDLHRLVESYTIQILNQDEIKCMAILCLEEFCSVFVADALAVKLNKYDTILGAVSIFERYLQKISRMHEIEKGEINARLQ